MRFVISILMLVGCASRSRGPEYPPAVHTGEAELLCTISASENGVQKLRLDKGGGLAFEAVVSPIVDGTVALQGPEKGGMYKFTSHLAQPAKGKLTGVGDVDIVTLETRVQVSVKRYEQAGGPGTEFSFNTDDIVASDVYVEFVGEAKSTTGERYAFRMNLGAAAQASGNVKPADANDDSRIVAKSVRVYAPTTTAVQTEVRRLP